MKPKFPIISIDKNAVDIIPDETYLNKTTVLGIQYGNSNSISFDGNGEKWKLSLTSDKVNDNLITRFLANTFYNPTVDAIIKWENIGVFKIEEIKNKLIKCVEKDDDLLTQFIDSETITNYINKANSFDDIYEILLKYIFEYQEEN